MNTTPPTRTHPAGADRPSTPTPRAIAWVDGRVVPAHEATVPLLDEGFLRGDAVFESVLVRSGHTHALEAHLGRMRQSARALDLRLPILRQVVTDLLAAWGRGDGVLKLIVTRSGTIRGIVTAVSWPDSISLAVIDVPWRTPLSGIKTLSYAVNQWATRHAAARDADDAIVCDRDQLLELPTGTLCLVHGGAITTPDATRLPILESVTLLELRRVTTITPTLPTVADLRTADELFVVSATRPVLPVHAVLAGEEQHAFPAPGPVTSRVHRAFQDHIADTLDSLI